MPDLPRCSRNFTSPWLLRKQFMGLAARLGTLPRVAVACAKFLGVLVPEGARTGCRKYRRGELVGAIDRFARCENAATDGLRCSFVTR